MSQLNLNTTDYKASPTIFVDAILPLPLPKLYTYRIPRDMEQDIAVGSRIVVPFGRNKILTAIIFKVHHLAPQDYQAKYIIDLLELTPSVNSQQLVFFKWLAEYYQCTLGEIIQAAVPSGLKINTTSLIQRNPHFAEEENILSIEEQLVMQQLTVDKPIESVKIGDLVGQKNLTKILKGLINKDAILLFDSIKEKYSPKIKRYLKLAEYLLEDDKKLEDLFIELERKPKQLEVVMAYLKSVSVLEEPELNNEGLLLSDLTEQGCSNSSIKTLTKNNVVEIFKKEVSRFDPPKEVTKAKTLSKLQLIAKQEILACYVDKEVVLLHGITGSGKTEIYVDLIQETLAAGHQVLYLLPEIALTSQIVSRLEGVFGLKMGVYHSKYSANERVEVWKNLQADKIGLVIGVRSAIFLPFSDLGLVIIDEEHESSFKQYDPAPRYHARDAALMLAKIHNAKSLMGSATPSVESYYLAQSALYGYVKLSQRHEGAVLPELATIDLNRANKTKEMRGNFSNQLIAAIKKTLSENEQVIIFQNRRGYSPFLSCVVCGWVPKCKHCDVSLTYHQYKNEIRCHYCGYKLSTPTSCSACGSTHLKTVSFGTEQLEEELTKLFPEVEVARLDLDTTRGRGSYERIISAFSSGKTRILVGTQMVAKGLDFDHVGLVGIIDLDRMLHFPDFRSIERTFQLAVQVAGRAGRKKKQGHVLIQTYNPGHAIVSSILAQDYGAFYSSEIEERRLFNYPPFTRMIKLTVKSRDHNAVSSAVDSLYSILLEKLGHHVVLNPITPLVSRIRDRYLRELYLKVGRTKDIASVKKLVRLGIHQIVTAKKNKSISIIIDIDPT